MIIKRVINKLYRESYILFHPTLWGKKCQINGIPKIGNMSKLSIGKHVSLNDKAYIQSVGGVILSDYVTVSYGVVVLTSGLETRDYPSICQQKCRPHITASVTIGEGVWLGACCMIMPGVTIAPKIIVAAGSVVTKNLDQEGWLYGGIPAKPIKPLMSD